MQRETPESVAGRRPVSAQAARPSPPRYFPIPRLRLGSVFQSRRGVRYTVREVWVQVSQSGGETPLVTVERVSAGQSRLLTMTVGMLANFTRSAKHRPGPGPALDWSSAERKATSAYSVARMSVSSLDWHGRTVWDGIRAVTKRG